METPRTELAIDRPRVFISYSHDSDEHRKTVLALSERLRGDGIETLLDQYVNGSPPQGWPRWMLDQLDASDFVLVVCTETYHRRFRGHEEPRKGKGVDWEGALITQEIYDARSRTLKFVPVFLSAPVDEWIPEPLRSGTHYALISESAYQQLYDSLLQQAGIEPSPIGVLKTKPRSKGTPLTFSEPRVFKAAKFDISRILEYAPDELIGREAELKLLDDAWAKVITGELKRPHIVIFVALGGEGKTSLVAEWVARFAHQGWPGCDDAFAWSFYSQGTREQVAASSDLFLKEALIFFGDDADKEFAAGPAGAFEKGQRLARVVAERRNLLILDGLEPLQYPFGSTAFQPGELKDEGVAKLLKDLATAGGGLCVVTTRIRVPDLRAFVNKTVLEEELTRLGRNYGVELLKKLGVHGNERRNIPLKDSDPSSERVNEFEKLVEDVKGHALTLTLLGGFLSRAFHGDIRQRDRVKFEKADEKIDGGHAFRAMAAYEQWLLNDAGAEGEREVAVLRLMGLFDRPADADCLKALRSETIPDLTEPLDGLADDDWEYCLSGLETAKLLSVNRDTTGALVSLDAHPHVREYFAKQLREQQPDSWRAAHRRLYQHLCSATVEGVDPTLEALQPLFQAVAHGCLAGLHEESFDKTFFARIHRGTEYYAHRRLGAFGSDLSALACFFDNLWDEPSRSLPARLRRSVLAGAGFSLRANGRIKESLAPVRAAMDDWIRNEDWENAAVPAGNLSELELTLGEVVRAVAAGEQAVTFADRSGYAFQRLSKRTTHADALHQAGKRAEAGARFREAEQIQAESQPRFHLLYSIGSFRYCDLLLADAERAAWQIILRGASPPAIPAERSASKTQRARAREGRFENAKQHEARLTRRDPYTPLVESCNSVIQRVTQTLNWTEGSGTDILSPALDHLTLGRAGLYAVILEQSASLPLQAANREIGVAVSGLRRAGQQFLLMQGLLSRAWLRYLAGAHIGPESAQEDLDEAWETVERGPMKLFMADIHLYRARLYCSTEQYPWKSPVDDLAKARALIEACGYWRRKEELEDAETALAAIGMDRADLTMNT